MYCILRYCIFLWLLSLPLFSQSPPLPDNAFQRGSVHWVPESYLREYDPITLFLKKDQGPAAGGPVDLPVSWFQVVPDHPGILRWLDGKTLQFTPTIPWTPLTTYRMQAFGQSHALAALVQPPTQILPAPGVGHLDPNANLTLYFSQAMPSDLLAAMLFLEVSPLPGLKDQQGYRLSQRDFALKALERQSSQEDAAYYLTLHRPLPDGHSVELQIQVAPDRGLTQSLLRYRFQTRTPFRLVQVGIGSVSYPIAAQGSVYQKEQLLNGGPQPEPLFLEFSHDLADPGIAAVKHLVGFQPAVENLRYEVQGNRLYLHFQRDSDRSYQLHLRPTAIPDVMGRPLEMPGPSELWFFFPSQASYLGWDTNPGILERFGSQELPLVGFGDNEVDLRIYKVDGVDLNFWPMDSSVLGPIDETSRPPGPGEEPLPYQAMADHIRLLGAPAVSRIVQLPLEEKPRRMRFGLNLGPMLADISGKEAPATYLVGIRRLDESAYREYTRIQVTDLNLSTWESRQGITFVVTSLQSGKPIPGASIVVEARNDPQKEPHVLLEGTTNSEGLFTYSHNRGLNDPIFRILVKYQDDLLVLDPNNVPSFFFDNHWYSSNGTWLDWLRWAPSAPPLESQIRAHLFSERPLYRPEEEVHISGLVRNMVAGKPETVTGDQWQLRIIGPGDKQWTYPVSLDKWGTFYLKWNEKDLPTGRYDAFLIDRQSNNRQIGALTFKKEPYRIPKFEVNLLGPDQARLDQTFRVQLVADYYAGGRVVGQEVLWRISREPISFRAPDFPGFLFSSQARFGGPNETPGEPVSTKREKTDEAGGAVIDIDPTQYPESGPMRYVVEAEVRGTDEQSVSSVKTISVMPPFTLGLKLPRVIKNQTTVDAESLVIGPDGKALAGQEYRIRLMRRQWHAYLRESDFTTGDVKYETDIVDVPILEETHFSTANPEKHTYAVEEAGVYVLEMAARDHLGRLQKVFTDFFVAGNTAVSWEKSKDMVFEMAWDKDRYNPDEVATLILKSPFQEARALIAVESPEGLAYHWVPIQNGQGMFEIRVTAGMAKQIPVHGLLVRGRVGSGQPLAKPMALGSSQTLRVNPLGFQAKLSLNHQASQLPGSSMALDLQLEDPQGQPLNGKVTLWLVDRAVLALAREANLNPVDTFIRSHESTMRLRDTRNRLLGEIPLEEMPGGDGAEERGLGLFGQVTVRRNFKTVPYFNANVEVVNGKASVSIPLPDNLTEFAIRAVGVAENQRFAFAKSTVALRLPVIVQSALPRFVRASDSFEAGGIARLVEGEDGPGNAAIQVQGLNLEGPVTRDLQWQRGKPIPLFFPLRVQAQANPLDQPVNTVSVSIAVQRTSDSARDAFEVTLPVRPDRRYVYEETFFKPSLNQPFTWSGPKEAPREGTLSRTLRASSQAETITMLAGLQFNARYPYGCLEQQVSQVFPQVALKSLLDTIGYVSGSDAEDGPLIELLLQIEQSQNENGLFGFWPGSRGQVTLTAYVTDFLLTARDSGYEIDSNLLDKALGALKASLRSDSKLLLRGYGLEERSAALMTLTRAGIKEPGYMDDLATAGRNLSLEGEASVLSALLTAGRQGDPIVERMVADLRQGLNITMDETVPRLRDLQYRVSEWDGPLLASKVTTLARVTEALHRFDSKASEVPLLTQALLRLGAGDGWGDTRSNAAALLTLGEILELQSSGATLKLKLSRGGTDSQVGAGENGMAKVHTTEATPVSVTLLEKSDGSEPLIWMQTAYLPQRPGDQAPAIQEGFAVTRSLSVLGPDGSSPPKTLPIQAGTPLNLSLGHVVEEQVQVVNPEDRLYVAISIPFAAGMDPLNPNLATAPSYATPGKRLSLQPSYIQFQDDSITYFYDQLPKGTYDFYLRLKTTTVGSFVQPPTTAELMYRQTVYGQSPGARVIISRETNTQE